MRNFTQRCFYSLLLACITLGALGMKQEQDESSNTPSAEENKIEKTILLYLKKSDLPPGRYLQNHLFEEMPSLEPTLTIKDVGRCTFSADGSTMAVETWNRLKAYDVKTGKLLIEIPSKFLSSILSYVLSPDGSKLLIDDCINKQELELYNLRTGKKYATLERPSDYTYLQQSGDGSTFIIHTKTASSVWDFITDEGLFAINRNALSGKVRMVLSFNGATLLVEDQNALMTVPLPVVEGGPCVSMDNPRPGKDWPNYELTADGSKLVLQDDDDNTLKVLDIKKAQWCASIPRDWAHDRFPQLSDDSSKMLIIPEDKLGWDDSKTEEFRLYDLETGELRSRIANRHGYNNFTFEGSRLVIRAGYGYEWKVYDTGTGRKQYSKITGMDPPGFSRDNSMMLVTKDKSFMPYDVQNGIAKGKIPREHSEEALLLAHGRVVMLESPGIYREGLPNFGDLYKKTVSIYDENSPEVHAFLKQFAEVKKGCFSQRMVQARNLVQGLNHILWMRKEAKNVLMYSDTEKYKAFVKRCGQQWSEIKKNLYEENHFGRLTRKLPQLELKPEHSEVYNDPILFPERICKCLEGCVIFEEEFFTAPSSPVGEFLDECLV